MSKEFLWVEKYRPKTVDETVLPDELKATFKQFVQQKNIPNLLLCGRPGVGKTTVARAMLEELGCDYIVINGSLNGNIDTLRNDIRQFASSISFSEGRKYVILDEADYLNPNSTQPALRNFMEEYSTNCGFILTCNFKNRIIEPLHSRCSVIEFKFDKKIKLAVLFMKRITQILVSENIEYEAAAIAGLINKFFPDWRRIINELQRYSATGKIDSGILVNFSDEKFEELVNLLKEKNFTQIRKWVANNTDIDSTSFFRKIYEILTQHMIDNSIPQLVLIIANYQYKAAFVADQEINTLACLIEIMADCTFKGN